MQNAAVRLIVGAAKNEQMSLILHIQLHSLPVKFSIYFKLLILTYKASNNEAPDYILELLPLYKPSRALRSPVKCFLLYLKLKLSFMGTDRLLPASFGMHYR